MVRLSHPICMVRCGHDDFTPMTTVSTPTPPRPPLAAWQDESGSGMMEWLSNHAPAEGWTAHSLRDLLGGQSASASPAAWCALYNAVSVAHRRQPAFRTEWLEYAWRRCVRHETPSDGDWCCAGLLGLSPETPATPDVANAVPAQTCMRVQRNRGIARSATWLDGLIAHAQPNVVEMGMFWGDVLRSEGHARRWASTHVPPGLAQRMLVGVSSVPSEWPAMDWPPWLSSESGWLLSWKSRGWFARMAGQDPMCANSLLVRLGSHPTMALAVIALVRRDATMMPWSDLPPKVLACLAWHGPPWHRESDAWRWRASMPVLAPPRGKASVLIYPGHPTR